MANITPTLLALQDLYYIHKHNEKAEDDETPVNNIEDECKILNEYDF